MNDTGKTTQNAQEPPKVCALCLTVGGGHNDPTCPAKPSDTQNDTSELDAQLDEILAAHWQVTRSELKEPLTALIAQREQAAELRGMERAKSRVLRRTEIPADAKNPTRDATVYLGEEIADIIQRDIDELQATKPEKENTGE